MLFIYHTVGDEIVYEDNFEKGSWINLINPTEAEIQKVVAGTGLSYDFLKYPLDDEELSRVETEDDQVLIIFNAPIMTKDAVIYDTIPVGIVLNDDFIVTVCLDDVNLFQEYASSKLKGVATFKRTRFIFQLFNKKTKLFLKYLRDINKQNTEIERRLNASMKNQELFQLLNMQKSLVYFSTSLRANAKVLERILKSKAIKMYEEDKDLLDDVIIENTQAAEMAEIYSNISASTMNAFASLISNNLNNVVKFLTAITIILAIPTMFASFWGMNVDVPLTSTPWAFFLIIGISFAACGLGALFLNKKNML